MFFFPPALFLSLFLVVVVCYSHNQPLSREALSFTSAEDTDSQLFLSKQMLHILRIEKKKNREHVHTAEGGGEKEKKKTIITVLCVTLTHGEN